MVIDLLFFLFEEHLSVYLHHASIEPSSNHILPLFFFVVYCSDLNDLIFEFSNVSETQILEAGGDDYLAEKKAASDKVKNGEKLMGGDVSAADSSSESPVAGKRSKGIDKAFVLFKEVSESKMKAVARKAIAYGRRNLEDPATIISAIKNQLNDISADMESALNQFSSFDYGDSVKGGSSSDSSQNVSVSTELFNIKEINIVEDKLLRANLKKIYMNGKKNKLNSNIVVDEMLVLLKEKPLKLQNNYFKLLHFK